jgi:hypothetical protein
VVDYARGGGISGGDVTERSVIAAPGITRSGTVLLRSRLEDAEASAADAQGVIESHPAGAQGDLHGGVGAFSTGARACEGACPSTCVEVFPMPAMLLDPSGGMHAKPLVTITKATRNRLVKRPAKREGRCIMLTLCRRDER